MLWCSILAFLFFSCLLKKRHAIQMKDVFIKQWLKLKNRIFVENSNTEFPPLQDQDYLSTNDIPQNPRNIMNMGGTNVWSFQKILSYLFFRNLTFLCLESRLKNSNTESLLATLSNEVSSNPRMMTMGGSKVLK